MAIQKFALYDLIVDIIPGAILLVVLYSVAPISLYEGFFGISESLVPGIAVILLSYPVGRIVVHGSSSVLEDRLLSLYHYSVTKLRYYLGSPSRVSRNDNTEVQSNEESDNETSSIKGHDKKEDDLLESWYGETGTIPSGVSSFVIKEVKNGLEDIAGAETDTESLRRYGENILFPRDTLYGKYEILSTFFRHMTFISLLSIVIYVLYALLHLTGLSAQSAVNGSAPIHSWPPILLISLPIAALAIFVLCIWRWVDWIKSKNRAFVNDLHSYLREQNIIADDEQTEQSPSANHWH